MPNHKILVVDDEVDLREILQFNLQSAGFDVCTAASAEEALSFLEQANYDLILLDVMMGGMSGFEMARHLRQQLGINTPIIFLTAKAAETDLLRAFSVGADDYITKPFSFQEVLARVNAILRRIQQSTAHQAARTSNICIDNLEIDVERKLVFVDTEQILLSPKELGILITLVSAPGRVFSREEILAQVWRGETCVMDRTVDVHIARVRRKLGGVGMRIVNRQGYGYSFS